ncbi:uncharacterized protein KY384_006278 [Bacidia gigantensis]|uniref:uncharacterized protein n=1 Tax=Bacidia gigantensis TaxID=2732470 RepID=UPI001D040E60|nr:uncharacterized protein KY384_006278 [Bacidia gigantensis]KAG8528591.1 hypothetical protein KY384_006278 [Bacidia gigantensis]
MIPELALAAAGESLRNRPHTHDPWLKTVLVPFWTLQLLAQLTFLTFIIMDMMGDDLTFPNPALGIQGVKSGVWTVVLIVVTTVHLDYESEPWVEAGAATGAGAGTRAGGNNVNGGFWVVVLCVIEFLLFKGTLLYALIINIRHRRTLRRLQQCSDEFPIPMPIPTTQHHHHAYQSTAPHYELRQTRGAWADDAHMRAYEELVTRPMGLGARKGVRRAPSSEYSGSVKIGYVDSEARTGEGEGEGKGEGGRMVVRRRGGVLM